MAPAPQILRVRKDTVVLQLGFGKARLKGQLELVQEPDDSDESYVVKRAVDAASLSESLQKTRGVNVTGRIGARALQAQEFLRRAPGSDSGVRLGRRLGALGVAEQAGDCQ